MNEPLVSVLIPNKDRKDKLFNAVESVFKQTINDFEIVIVDGSEEELFQEIKEKYDSNPKVNVIREEGNSDPKARAQAEKESTGKYIAFLDSDDTWKEKKLEKHLEIWKENPEIGLSWDKWILNDTKENETKTQEVPGTIETENDIMKGDKVFSSLWVEGNFIHMSSGVTRRDRLEKVGGFPTIHPCDWTLWLRLSISFDIGYIDEELTVKNLGDDALSRAEDWGYIAGGDQNKTRLKMFRPFKLLKYYSLRDILEHLKFISKNTVYRTINSRSVDENL